MGSQVLLATEPKALQLLLSGAEHEVTLALRGADGTQHKVALSLSAFAGKDAEDVTLIASGSEVSLALKAREEHIDDLQRLGLNL